MKHRILSLSLLAVLFCTALVGCEKETEYNTIITVKGTDAKTHYNPSTHGVEWDEGDQIAVVRGNSSHDNTASAFTIQWPVASNGEAKFTGNIPEAASADAAYFALYPYQSDMTVDGYKITCTAIPHNQTLTTNSFGKGNNTAVGYDASTTMQFRNVGGLAKVAIHSEEFRVKSLKIVNTSTSGSTTLSGRGTINLQDSDLPIEWASSGTYNEVVATAAASDGFDVSEPKFFYLALPPCTMTKYRIVIVDENDGEHPFDFDNTVTISRASVTMLGAYEVIDNTERRKIYYTSTTGSTVTPYKTSGYGANFVSNEYSDGVGVITFDGPVTQIPEKAFHNCSTLSSISLPYAVASIGQDAFYQCTNLTSVEMQDRVTSIGGHAFQSCSSLTEVVLSSRLRTLGVFAFGTCSSLESITLPSGLTQVSDHLFNECSALTTVVIPSGITTIGEFAFSYCIALGSVTLPSTVTTIKKNAFHECTHLASISLPTSLTTIGADAFMNCSSLASISLPSSLTSLGNEAFKGCSALASLTIPASITAVPQYLCQYCSSLTTVNLPNAIASIGNWALADCTHLTTINCTTTTAPSTNEFSFKNVPADAVLHLPASCNGLTWDNWGSRGYAYDL